jgi:hypothetical protein
VQQERSGRRQSKIKFNISNRACPSYVRPGYPFQVLAKFIFKIILFRCGLSSTIPHAKK